MRSEGLEGRQYSRTRDSDKQGSELSFGATAIATGFITDSSQPMPPSLGTRFEKQMTGWQQPFPSSNLLCGIVVGEKLRFAGGARSMCREGTQIGVWAGRITDDAPSQLRPSVHRGYHRQLTDCKQVLATSLPLPRSRGSVNHHQDFRVCPLQSEAM